MGPEAPNDNGTRASGLILPVESTVLARVVRTTLAVAALARKFRACPFAVGRVAKYTPPAATATTTTPIMIHMRFFFMIAPSLIHHPDECQTGPVHHPPGAW